MSHSHHSHSPLDRLIKTVVEQLIDQEHHNDIQAAIKYAILTHEKDVKKLHKQHPGHPDSGICHELMKSASHRAIVNSETVKQECQSIAPVLSEMASSIYDNGSRPSVKEWLKSDDLANGLSRLLSANTRGIVCAAIIHFANAAPTTKHGQRDQTEKQRSFFNKKETIIILSVVGTLAVLAALLTLYLRCCYGRDVRPARRAQVDNGTQLGDWTDPEGLDIEDHHSHGASTN